MKPSLKDHFEFIKPINPNEVVTIIKSQTYELLKSAHSSVEIIIDININTLLTE